MKRVEDLPIFGPVDVDRVHVLGWTCDHCDEVHISLTFRANDAQEAGLVALQVEEGDARHLAEEILKELESPAPGAGGAVGIKLPEEWGVET